MSTVIQQCTVVRMIDFGTLPVEPSVCDQCSVNYVCRINTRMDTSGYLARQNPNWSKVQYCIHSTLPPYHTASTWRVLGTLEGRLAIYTYIHMYGSTY
jgi:hypothetical protein